MSGQSDLVNTKESVVPVCDKPYHMKKRNTQKEEEIKVLQNYALPTESRGSICQTGQQQPVVQSVRQASSSPWFNL